MITRKSVCISITPELDRFVAAQLARGRYQTASEVFRAGLRLLEREEAKPRVTRAGVRRKHRQRPEDGE